MPVRGLCEQHLRGGFGSRDHIERSGHDHIGRTLTHRCQLDGSVIATVVSISEHMVTPSVATMIVIPYAAQAIMFSRCARYMEVISNALSRQPRAAFRVLELLCICALLCAHCSFVSGRTP